MPVSHILVRDRAPTPISSVTHNCLETSAAAAYLPRMQCDFCERSIEPGNMIVRQRVPDLGAATGG